MGAMDGVILAIESCGVAESRARVSDCPVHVELVLNAAGRRGRNERMAGCIVLCAAGAEIGNSVCNKNLWVSVLFDSKCMSRVNFFVSHDDDDEEEDDDDCG